MVIEYRTYLKHLREDICIYVPDPKNHEFYIL